MRKWFKVRNHHSGTNHFLKNIFTKLLKLWRNSDEISEKSDRKIGRETGQRSFYKEKFYNWNLQLSYSMLKLAKINLTLIKWTWNVIYQHYWSFSTDLFKLFTGPDQQMIIAKKND